MCPLDARPRAQRTHHFPAPFRLSSALTVDPPSERARPLFGALEAQRGAGPSGPRAKALLIEFSIDVECLPGVVILAGKPLRLVLERDIEGYLDDFLGRQSGRPPQSPLVNFLFRHDRLLPPRSRSLSIIQPS